MTVYAPFERERRSRSDFEPGYAKAHRPGGFPYRPKGNPQVDLDKAGRTVQQLLNRLDNPDKLKDARKLEKAISLLGKRYFDLAEVMPLLAVNRRRAPFNRRHMVQLVADLQAFARR
jgi:hypothetical protein